MNIGLETCLTVLEVSIVCNCSQVHSILNRNGIQAQACTMASLDELPGEILLMLSKYLGTHDISQLILTSNAFLFLQSSLWKTIEMHHPVFHEYQPKSRLLHRHVNANSLSRDDPIRLCWPDNGLQECEHFLRVSMQIQSSRWVELATHTRELCISFPGDQKGAFEAIRWFRNLERLDLTGFYSYGWERHSLAWDSRAIDTMLEAPDPTIYPTLKSLNLRGYLPKTLVLNVLCSTSPRLQRLNLGILEPAQGEVFEPSTVETNEHAQGITSDESLNSIPPPYVAAVWLPPSGQAPFKSLTHLTLCKPLEDPDPVNDDFNTAAFRTADKLVLQEWKTLLLSSRTTLISITLDLRELLSSQFLADVTPAYTRRVHVDDEGEAADHALRAAFVVPLFRDHSWPALRKLEIRGLAVNDPSRGWSMQRLGQLLRRWLGPAVDVRLRDGHYMFYDEVWFRVDAAFLQDALLPVEGLEMVSWRNRIPEERIRRERGWFEL